MIIEDLGIDLKVLGEKVIIEIVNNLVALFTLDIKDNKESIEYLKNNVGIYPIINRNENRVTVQSVDSKTGVYYTAQTFTIDYFDSLRRRMSINVNKCFRTEYYAYNNTTIYKLNENDDTSIEELESTIANVIIDSLK